MLSYSEQDYDRSNCKHRIGRISDVTSLFRPIYISHLIRADSHFVPRNRFQELDIIIIDHYVHTYIMQNFYLTVTILKMLA